MQFIVGCITFQNTSGHLSTRNFHDVTLSHLHPNLDPDLLSDEDLARTWVPDYSQSSLREYTVTLSSGESMYILAANAMDAAYSALELSEDRQTKLLNVQQTDEW